MADDKRFSFHLYRETLGHFDFRGPARLYYDSQFGRVEHYLLELHEHNHWGLAHSTVFGIEQLSLAYAHVLAKNPVQRQLYHECLKETVDASREVYEGCAVYEEESCIRGAKLKVSDEWFSLLQDPIYSGSRQIFVNLAENLSFCETLKASLAKNAAELSLNSAPRFLTTPAQANPARIRETLKRNSPNRLFHDVARCLAQEHKAFEAEFRIKVLERIAEEFKLPVKVFDSDKTMPGADKLLVGTLSYSTYRALRDFARSHGVSVSPSDPSAVDLERYDIWFNWVRRLPGHQVYYPNLVKDTATFPLGTEPDNKMLETETYDFSTFQTAFEPPPTDPRDDIEAQDWQPVYKSFEFAKNDNSRLYLSIDDAQTSSMALLAPVLTSSNLTALVGGASDGSTWLSSEEGIQRFREETVPPPTTLLSIRATRALLRLQDGCAWRFSGSGYRLLVKIDQLATTLAELRNIPTAVVLPWNAVDIARQSVWGTDLSELPGTIGLLLNDSSFYGWKRALASLAAIGFTNHIHISAIGTKDNFSAMFALPVRARVVPFFVLSLATESLRIKLISLLQAKKCEDLNATWLPETKTDLVDRAFLRDILLVCEHFVQRGY
jgi:hypothetical protein